MRDFDILHYLSDADYEDILSQFNIGAEYIFTNEIEVTRTEIVASASDPEGREVTSTYALDYAEFIDGLRPQDKAIFRSRALDNKTRLNGSAPRTPAVEAA